ncbi:hypothetical protein WA026_004982 [Henosepilachna vigintioctopunctata]|uniref:Uncharacterized protein n=1 Tax=Henosepilachna vigintioctopunctata TaxID=420089 RepID=A0AAW1UU89_9CUCU
MAKTLTTADKCLTLLVAVLVITNIILACSIGLILPRHITKDGWIYIDNMEGATNESLRISCTCIRTVVTRKNETAEESSEEVSKRRLECLMDGKGFKCLNHLSRNQSHNSSIETLPNEEIKFEPQNSSEIMKSFTVTSLMEETKVELSSTHEVLRKDITSLKSPKDSLVNNSTIWSITTRYQTEKSHQFHQGGIYQRYLEESTHHPTMLLFPKSLSRL